MGGRFPQGRDVTGTTVASFPSYEGAQRAVSRLISADVPARDIAIVGTGLRSVERVTGRLGYAAAARSGAINGILLGMLFSAVLVIGSPSVPIQAFVGVIFVGIALGMLLSIVAYSLVRRRRDFASVTQVVADHYEVTVSGASVQRARQVLGTPGEPAVPAEGAPVERAPGAPDAVPPAHPSAPPRYGERVAPAADASEPASSAHDEEDAPPRPEQDDTGERG